MDKTSSRYDCNGRNTNYRNKTSAIDETILVHNASLRYCVPSSSIWLFPMLKSSSDYNYCERKIENKMKSNSFDIAVLLHSASLR